MHVDILMASEFSHRIVRVIDYVLISKWVCECEIDCISYFAPWWKLILGIACRTCELMTES